MKQRVFVTGLGAVTPLGKTIAENWRAISSGESGITKITDPELLASGVKIAGQIKNFDAGAIISLKDAKRLDSHAKFGVYAAAQIDVRGVDPLKFGITLASSAGPIKLIQEASREVTAHGPKEATLKKVNPGVVIYGGSDGAAAYLSQKLGAKGPNFGLGATCASGTMGLGEAMRQIRHGYLDAVLVVGADDCLNPINLAANHNIRALTSEFEDEPERASRPFDAAASGFVMSQGAAAILLESETSLAARKAKALAEIVGYGATSDAFHATAPEPAGAGAARAMNLALADAGITAGDISYVNLHGTSTIKGDEAEFLALKSVFGEAVPPVCALKSFSGHLLGAAGVFETAMSVQALQEGVLPATRNIEQNRFGLNFASDKPEKISTKFVMKNSFGFGGHNAVIILRRPYT